ncbi:MAG: hypothetical protein NTY04_01285 [Candidatus Staskawiczbacteria bacterium]|nr:hypothetical protein [Candidatus Staskawiczbacteria bacterium]
MSLIPIEKLDNDNKNWLSTYEYSESILANKNLEEKDAQREFAYTIAVLYEFIQKNNQ